MEIIFTLIGFVIVALGIFLIVKDKLDKGKESLNAVVVACQQAEPAFGNSSRNLYNLTLEIDGKNVEKIYDKGI